MRRLAVTVLMLAIASIGATESQAHLITKPKCETLRCVEKSQIRNLAHARGFVAFAKKHGVNNRHVYWHWKATTWLAKELRQTRELLNPKPSVDKCLSDLIWRESKWNVFARNPTSGAYGLPQALPGSKMASHGADWAWNKWTQIRWMIDYVNERYGGSCNALAFQIANGWY